VVGQLRHSLVDSFQQLRVFGLGSGNAATLPICFIAGKAHVIKLHAYNRANSIFEFHSIF
jgi:hypothetical protein